MGPLKNELGPLVMEGTEKEELLDTFFASVFAANSAPQKSGDKLLR